MYTSVTTTFEHSGVAQAPQNSTRPKIFCVYRTLGEGGFAKAILAQPSTDPSRKFCLKVFRKDQLKDMEDIILDELAVHKRIASLLPCPARNFLMGLEFTFQTKNEICFAMDLMVGDLGKIMIHRPSYCLIHSHRWTAQVALGIDTLHAMGIIHRDIKPENILIDVRENVRITDYGLCYMDQYEHPLYRERVYTTSAVGTTYCMSPEVLHNVLDPGSMEYGIPVDWWSFGCVVAQLFSREHEMLFHTQDDILGYVYRCSTGPLNRLSRRRIFKERKFHPCIADLLSGLLDPDPSTRYGMPQVARNKAFSCGSGKTLFSDAYNQAEEREGYPELLPQNKFEDPSELWWGLLPWQIGHIPNIDWVKPNYEQ
ncbi:kinase-like protein [Suillus brevipes Sb2]|nr:kinase-like protein [Suillus brevipes Sb2]